MSLLDYAGGEKYNFQVASCWTIAAKKKPSSATYISGAGTASSSNKT